MEVQEITMTYKGTVKFYNKEKGFGFIYVENKPEDVYFHINDWKNPTIPCGNDEVEFEIKTLEDEREKAVNIKLVKDIVKEDEIIIDEDNSNLNKVHKRNFNQDRILCKGCNRMIVPRLIAYTGNPSHSLCPFCGTIVADFRNKAPLINVILFLIILYIFLKPL